MKTQLRQTRKQYRAIQKAKLKQESRTARIFGKDQLNAMSRRSMNGVQWSPTTVRKALLLRFSCGSSGYKLLLKQGYPLPSERTLQRRLQNISFQPGVLTHVFELLKLKVQGLTKEERLCCLTLDEMSLTQKVEYDISSGELVGDVTLPRHFGSADHALVFMLGGVTSRWKQTIAYHFTTGSTDGTVFKDIILDIISHAADIGLYVQAVTSDMGSANRAMWKSFGIICGKHCKTIHRIPHPSETEGWLYFLADVPHLFKNIKSALISGQNFVLSKDTVERHQLCSNIVSDYPLRDLVCFQEHHELKLAPKLTKAKLAPSHFQKMKVSNATHVISHDVSSALIYLANKECRGAEHRTAAWFIETVNHWFELMTSRHPVMALSKMKPDKYRETRSFLQDVIALFKGIKIGKGEWKPCQTGVILTTTSVLTLAEDLLDAGHKYLLTGRLTQDCLENLFSVVRLRKPIPSPLEFKFALKLISTAQFLTLPRSGSYSQDDGEFLADFLKQDVQVPEDDVEVLGIILSDNPDVSCLPPAERASLYNLAGYCVRSVKKNETTCDTCISELTAEETEYVHPDAELTLLKEFKTGCFFRVSDKTFKMILTVEAMFRKAEDKLMDEKNVKGVLLERAQELTEDVKFAECHNIKKKLLAKFITSRLHFFCKKETNSRKKESSKKFDELGSKSMAMRKLATKVK